MKSRMQPTYKDSTQRKFVIPIMVAISIVLNVKTLAFCQGNNYFGANANSSGGGSSSDQSDDSNANAVLPGLNSTTQGNPPPTGTDFTGDEKRMQKKYKANIANANSLIAKGTQMMKSSEKNPSSPVYKRGKILKEIGEKSLAELKANNPFAGQKPPK